MLWVSFLVGLLCAPLLMALALRLFPNTLAPHAFQLAMNWVWRNQQRAVRVKRLQSLEELQPLIRSLVSFNGQGTVYVQSAEPQFVLTISKKVFRRKPALLVLEVRNTGANRAHYAAARDVMQRQGPTFSERLTPRQQQPSRASLQVEATVLATAAIVSAVRAVLESAGINWDSGLLVSDHDPCLWPAA